MARTIILNCFNCGRALAFEERVGFRERCPGCDRPAHACLNCVLYDAAYNNECRETSAERVADKDRANFCEYFRPGRLAPPKPKDDPRSKLDALFRKP